MEEGNQSPAPPNLSEYLREIGRKGGKARLKKMTKAQRSEIARKAAAASAAVRTKKAGKKRLSEAKMRTSAT